MPPQFTPKEPPRRGESDTDLDLAREGVQRTLGLNSSNSHSVEQALKLKEELKGKIENRCNEVAWQLYQEEGIRLGWSASGWDLHFAAISAYGDGSYTIPPLPEWKVSEDLWRVTRDNDPMLYDHFMNLMKKADGTGTDILAQAKIEGGVNINLNAYKMYVDMYQAIVRTFIQSPHKYEERMGEFVGDLVAFHALRGNAVPGVAPKELVIVKSGDDRLALNILRDADVTDSLPLEVSTNSLVLLPWSSTAVLRDFPAIARCPRNMFILETESKFVATALEQAAVDLGLKQVHVIHGPLSSVPYARETISDIVLCHEEERSYEEFKALALKAKGILRYGGAIHLLINDTNPSARANCTTSQIEQLFKDLGFNVSKVAYSNSEREVPPVGGDRRTVSELSSEEILKTMSGERHRIVLPPSTLLKITK